MRNLHRFLNSALCILAAFSLSCGLLTREAYLPGKRVLLDAHNCYPYQEDWADRIDRALDTGTPLAIEQDLVWYTDSTTGISRSIVSHGEPFTGNEPSLAEYFFERIRPVVEEAMQAGDTKNYPVIVLNLDFKTDVPEHHRAVWETLGRYEDWLTTAFKTGEIDIVMPLHRGPVLVLTGDSDLQQAVFYDSLAPGDRLRLFGAVHTAGDTTSLSPREIVSMGANNYRRWWNNPWRVVETGGQKYAGEWTEADERRLEALTSHAHSLGLWIRFYTLNGYDPNAPDMGWSAGYNFGSPEKVVLRWKAAITYGVDFIATDQYEAFSEILHPDRPMH